MEITKRAFFVANASIVPIFKSS